MSDQCICAKDQREYDARCPRHGDDPTQAERREHALIATAVYQFGGADYVPKERWDALARSLETAYSAMRKPWEELARENEALRARQNKHDELFPGCKESVDGLVAERDRLAHVIEKGAAAWLSLDPGVEWEGDLGDAMVAAVNHINNLRQFNCAPTKIAAERAERAEATLERARQAAAPDSSPVMMQLARVRAALTEPEESSDG